MLISAVLVPPRAAAEGPSPAIARGAAFILTGQALDGGFGPLGQTLDAVFALRASGMDPVAVSPSGRSALDFVVDHATEAEGSPGLAAKAALGAAALGLDPRSTGGVDFIAVVESSLDGETGLYASDAFTQALAILGLACTGNRVPASAITALRLQSLEDGGWGFSDASDPDTTALAIQALLAAGAGISSQEVQAALGFLRATQLPDGGWGFGESNTSSTAFAVQALIAAGENPAGEAYRRDGGTPIDYLLSQQDEDGGFAGYDRAFATNQVLPALAGHSFCSAPFATLDASLAPGAGTAPAPPTTGTGLAPRSGQRPPWLILAAMVLLLAGAGTAGASIVGRRP